MTTPIAIKATRWELYLAILLTVINIIGGTTFWLSLPEKIRATKEQLIDHEQRIRSMEKSNADNMAILTRVDERTKSMKEDLSSLRQEVFSFRAQAKP